jgi:DNA-binding MurR/RpiR family transcriptional regulator
MDRSIVFKSRGMQIVEAREGQTIEVLLRRLYEDDGMTQEQIAERLSVSASTVIRWMALLGIETRWFGPRKVAVG